MSLFQLIKESTKAQRVNQQVLKDKMEENAALMKETNKQVTHITELELEAASTR